MQSLVAAVQRSYCSTPPKKDHPKEELTLRDLKTRKQKWTWKSPITWRSLVITSIVGAGALAFMKYLKNEKDKSKILQRFWIKLKQYNIFVKLYM